MTVSRLPSFISSTSLHHPVSQLENIVANIPLRSLVSGLFYSSTNIPPIYQKCSAPPTPPSRIGLTMLTVSSSPGFRSTPMGIPLLSYLLPLPLQAFMYAMYVQYNTYATSRIRPTG
ncbi:hypothetical protein BU24DRAFT_30858 [Aaosphaeria arxii CBS 175.79]|uniref:Uncharacterized protein n=1 Tax=Aaosphaeria arxii CBS 175.79 TaxID=1450172 RepID=A0A6A5YA31_9PLEO|nr:uncharacterized protein BU24DRAFT_30858 [Aaosphaeria arxii CBS 175.79]KAF2021867.1 hypothetical protein BU24DRAFT_30858 [Aaosphaeria arxii CBS 175.79]